MVFDQASLCSGKPLAKYPATTYTRTPTPPTTRETIKSMIDLASLRADDRGRVISYCGQSGQLVGHVAGWSPSVVYVQFRCEDWPNYPHRFHTFTCSAIYPEHLAWTKSERALVAGSNGSSPSVVHRV